MAHLHFSSAHRYHRPIGQPGAMPRPLLPVRLHHGQADPLQVLALVDSGADVSAFHTSLAIQLGIDLASCRRSRMVGVGGITDAYRCDIEIEVEGHRFPIEASFVSQVVALLGRHDVFMRFMFAFDQRAQALYVEPY